MSLAVYAIDGTLVRSLVNETLSAGVYEIVWNGVADSGHQAASGIYFYQLMASDFVETKKMTLIK